ncbi:hypothetical protein PROFUN_06191 [Planoprotostelium fungivorum]|uniref:Right handed beta helix domain-containing protein n=1 Tax=Planoprotostelium fungivorum TaxID=1890364 RepID=A0A2P6MYZ6_9EUKA|nr:hypothetical protein PROFUN_06191 [Planoprotostelium fungivorum]
MNPCRSIPHNSTNVCLSSGQYNIRDRMPSQIRGWWSNGFGTQIPRITCLNAPKISCDVQPSIFWKLVDIDRCSMVRSPNCREVTLRSVRMYESRITIRAQDASPNSTFSDCLFNHTTVSLLHTPPSESSTSTAIASSLFLFTSNHLMGSSAFSFSDNTTDVRSHHAIMNNTHDPSSKLSRLTIQWSDAQDLKRNERHIIVKNNTLPQLNIHLVTMEIPDLRLTGNTFTLCRIDYNSFSTIVVTKSGSPVNASILMHHNRVGVLAAVDSNGVTLLLHHNDIRAFNLIESKGYETRRGDVISDNKFVFFTYVITQGKLSTPVKFDRNIMSSARIILNMDLVPMLLMQDTIWTGPIKETNTPALHLQMMYGFFLLRNTSIHGYSEGGIKVSSTTKAAILIDTVSISNCGRGAISMTVENSNIDIKSSTLYNNTSPTVGGAISISTSTTEQTVVIRDCRLIHNRSPHGSALSISGGDIQVENVDIIVEDDVDNPLNDHSVLYLYGKYDHENVSLSCAEERYLASSNASSSLVWSCRPCASGTYFLGRGEVVGDVEKGNECTRCPEKGVECIDGKTPQAKPNYWCGKNSLQQLICHNCPSGYCNETAHLWNSSCIGHRSGELCGGCADGYTLGFLTSACLPVDHCRHEWIGLLSIIPFVYVTVLLFLPIGDGSMWKSMSYFVQTVPLLLKQERQNSIITMFSSLFTTPTNMGSSLLGFCVGSMHYIERELISLYIPAGTIFLFLFACLSALLYHKMGCTIPRRKIMFLTQALDKRSMLSRCTTGLVAGFLLMYSGLIGSYLKLYFCIEIEPERWVMYNAGTERCDQWWRTPFVSVASILLLPSPLLLLFIRRRLKGTERETGRDVLMVLDGCYRQSTKYWESVYMVRRVVIAVAYVFITDERWSATVMRFLLLTALFLHLVFTPFVTAAGQWLETICLLSLCCLTLLNGQLEERYSHAFLVNSRSVWMRLKQCRSSSRYRS